MCFFSQPQMPSAAAIPATPPVAPPPAAAPAGYGGASGASAVAPNPVMTNMYDPSSPESGIAAEKGAAIKKASGTSQLKVDLDPTVAGLDKGTGLQITN
tara:strand:- start:43 stop:339 length:297 start_codon:yes stop_codon:yes gene_type:complete